MTEVRRSALLDCTPGQMFALVDAVEDYPAFLPWCSDARVSRRDASSMRATLFINFHGIRQSFTTENDRHPPSEMRMHLVEGPFRKLEGRWRFTDLSGRGCKVEFSLEYEFASRALERVVGPVFDRIANTLLEAFVNRASRVYGAPSASGDR